MQERQPPTNGLKWNVKRRKWGGRTHKNQETATISLHQWMNLEIITCYLNFG